MEKIIVLGMGGHAESLVDAIESQHLYEVAGYVVNENNASEMVKEYPVIGKDEDLQQIFQSGIRNAAIGVGYLGKSDVRERLWKILKKIGYCLPVICDKSAVLAKNVELAEGSFIGKGAIINTNVSIGKLCIINTGAIVEHDCHVGDFSHISVGTVLCGGVTVGKAAFVGANATVIQGTRIGNRSIVGAGTVIRKNVEDSAMVWSRSKICVKVGGGKLIHPKRCAA